MLVGITGPAGHGKDTFANFLLEELPNHRPYAFADPIKKIAHEAFKGELPSDSREHKEASQKFSVNAWDLMRVVSKVLGTEFAATRTLSLLNVLQEHTGDYATDLTTVTFTGSWRLLYQLIGTEWGRQTIDLDVWINKCPYINTVVTDVRGQGDHPTNTNTEAIYILNNGGVVINVFDERKAVPQCRAHSSEAGIDDNYITYHVDNSGSLEDLREQAKQIAKELK